MFNKKLKVLIIDDSLMMRTILKEIVTSDPKMEVVGSACDGKEGLDMVKQHNPDAILLDLEMPVMNGIEFLKRVRLISLARIIVVSYTARNEETKEKIMHEHDVYKVVGKPSGSVSLNLEEERGSEILTALRRLIS